MVVLVQRWQQRMVAILAVFGALALDRFVAAIFEMPREIAMEPIGSEHYEDFAESEVMSAIFARPVPEQAPPMASMPTRNRVITAWPQEPPFIHPWRASPVVTILGNGPAPPGAFRVA